jgi:regulator of nucleoside diphosphate kinase
MMSMKSKATTLNGAVKARITLTAVDYERLSQLARAAANAMPDQVAVLTEELARAEVVADGLLEQTVRMGSEVTFRDDSTGKIETMTLVYPGEADIARQRISVMTPVGTALIGLGIGDSITWATRSGEIRLLTVLDVR